jgi:hypothetical protein
VTLPASSSGAGATVAAPGAPPQSASIDRPARPQQPQLQPQPPGPVHPTGWTVQTSRSTGRRYWFNVRTGVSTFDEPAELSLRANANPTAEASASAGGAPARHPSMPPPGVAGTAAPSHRPAAQQLPTSTTIAPITIPDNLASLNPVQFRAVVEGVCKALLLAKWDGPDAGAFRFPPDCDKQQRWMM